MHLRRCLVCRATRSSGRPCSTIVVQAARGLSGTAAAVEHSTETSKHVFQVLGAMSVCGMFYFQSQRLGDQARKIALLEAALQKELPDVYKSYQQRLSVPPPVEQYAVAQPLSERLLGKGAKLGDVAITFLLYPAICLFVAGVTHRLSMRHGDLVMKAAQARTASARRALGATGVNIHVEAAIAEEAAAAEEIVRKVVSKKVATLEPAKGAVLKMRRSLAGNMGAPSILHVRKALGSSKLQRRQRGLPKSLQHRAKPPELLPAPPMALLTPQELHLKRRSMEDLIEEMHEELEEHRDELVAPTIIKGSKFETDMIDEALESKRQENIDKEIKAKAELFL